MQQAREQFAAKPASGLTLFQAAFLVALYGSVVRDGDLSPADHSDFAAQIADAAMSKLAQRGAE